MAHFAKLDATNTVIRVHAVHNDVATTEQAGIDFLNELHGFGWWKQTSYSGSFRKNYAGAGYLYDKNRDAFIPPKPFPSWVLNETTCRWEAPVSIPDNDKEYKWNEYIKAWEEVI